MSQSPAMTINGRPCDTAQRLTVCNPATGAVFADVPDAGRAELDASVAAARAAFPGWRATPWAARAQIVQKIGETIVAHAPELIAMLTREQGKPFDQAQFEVMAAAQWCVATATLTLPDRIIEDSPQKLHVTRYEPIGVICGISPWNFPVVLSIFKIAPALLAGNTLVLKPSPFTPLTVLRIGELLRGIAPDGVLNIISGGDELGPLMTAHPGFDKISFTGSTATGKKVMETAAKDLKRVTLELGGNDAAIVFPDVDVKETAEKLFWSAFTNSGQVCIATKRAYIHEKIYDEMLTALGDLARSIPMGAGGEQGNRLGPIQNLPQRFRVQAIVQESEAAGDRILRGFTPPGEGFFEPIILIDNPPDERSVVALEQFGPVLPTLKFSDEDDVVQRANASDMGLAATIWTKDEARALRIADRLEVGSVWINEGLGISPFAAFGGRKFSGLGVENGVEGLMAYTQPKTISIARAPTTG